VGKCLGRAWNYGLGLNLHSGNWVQRSLPCVVVVDLSFPARWPVTTGQRVTGTETITAKEARGWDGLPRKTPRLFALCKVCRGLKCGLSGNLALLMETRQTGL